MAEGGSDDIQSLACIKDLRLEEPEAEMMTTTAESKVIIRHQHHYYHRNVYVESNVNHGDGDFVQGSKTQVKDSQIEALITPSGGSDPPTQQHPEELSGDNTPAALESIGEKKILTQVIENADDTSAGNHTYLKQIVGNPDSGISDSAPGARRKTKPDLNECIQTKLKEVHVYIDELAKSTDNLVREKEVYSILCETASAIKPLDTHQDWTFIEGCTTFSIKYDRESRYRKDSKVFNAIRESGGDEQKIIVKFVPDFDEKNKREIDSLWATTGHENVVKYFRSGFCKFERKKSIFIAMEKCEKDTLYEKIQAGKTQKAKKLSYAVRKYTVLCIAKGLQHLKKKGIVHRDLKPQNILYRGDVPVISDFGLSKKISEDKTNTQQTEKNLGTNGWRAPETSKENGTYSFAGDIYSAGLVTYYILTNGKHPFDEESEDSDDWQNLIKNYPNKNYLTIGMERNLEDLKNIGVLDETIAIDMIELMLNPEPKDRSTVEAVLENPIFWTVEKKLKFFADTHKCIEHDNPSKSKRTTISKPNEEEGDGKQSKDKMENQSGQNEKKNPSQSEITIFLELNTREGKHGKQLKNDMGDSEDESDGKMKDKKLQDDKGDCEDQSGGKTINNWKDKLNFNADEKQIIQDNFVQQNRLVDVKINEMALKAKNYETSVTELLRFIRNRYTHMNGDEYDGTINQSEEQLLNYFSTDDRFPHLFVYVYCKIKDNYYGKSESKNCCTKLAKYFPLLQPQIIPNEVNDKLLEIKWEPVICANHYKLEIYTNSSVQEQPVFKINVGKKTEWVQAFDDKFGNGTSSYYAVVTAVGEGNKRSSNRTDQKQIGGDGDQRRSIRTDQKQIGGDGDKKRSTRTDQKQIGGDGDKRSSTCTDQKKIST